MAKTMEFKTEVSKLLDIVIHSLYSNKDIFLRELISNSSDAIDKIRYEGITDASKYENDTDFKIKLTADKEAKTITISDNGIGMEYDEVIATLGTIAASGTKEFMKMLEEKKDKSAELIGQFGVGFYSAFMVAEQVDVLTKKALATDAVKWSSKADGKFSIDKAERTTRGTDVILHIREDELAYLDEWKLRELVSKYSDYIEHKIVMDVKRKKVDEEGKQTDEEMITTEEVLNSQKAIWLKDKASITEEEYDDFYKHITHDYGKPLSRIHFKAEGTNEFSALLYIPEHKPFDIIYKEYQSGPMLYVKRVQIMEHCEELFPPYLRFVKGVVESDDLPLNISREILQNNRQIEVIRKNIVKRILDDLKTMKDKEYDSKYLKFYGEFARVLKEGLHYDHERKEQISDLLLFHSTKTEEGKYTTLDEYLTRMKTDQNEIYYILAKSRADALSSPYLEGLIDKDIEVLIMTDDIDDIVISALREYKTKKFKSVVKGDIELDDEAKKKKEERVKDYKDLVDFIKTELKDSVADVRLSSRLKDSAVCLVTGDQDFDPYIEQMMKAMGEKFQKGKRVMEINPDHSLFVSMKTLFEKDKTSATLKDYAALLYDQALILEGDKPIDAARFTKNISNLMAKVIA